MSKKQIVHVVIPYTTEVLCKSNGIYANHRIREMITCKLCRKHTDFKKLTTTMSSQQAKSFGYRKK